MSEENSALHDVFMGHAEATERRLVALHARYVAGEMTADAFVSLAAALVGQANAQAVALADLSLSAWLTAQTRTATPTLGLVAPEDAGRLQDGLRTLLAAVDGLDTPEARVGRFGRAEPARAFQRGYSEGMARRPEVGGWTRRLNVGACELCGWLAQEGRVFPASRAFTDHPGCGCHPEPVLA